MAIASSIFDKVLTESQRPDFSNKEPNSIKSSVSSLSFIYLVPDELTLIMRESRRSSDQKRLKLSNNLLTIFIQLPVYDGGGW